MRKSVKTKNSIGTQKLTFHCKKKAFTLVEITFSIIIIGLLFSMLSISIKEIRRNSRDTKRVSDITQVQLALEQYYRDEGFYPKSLIFGQGLTGSSTDKVYMAKLPNNPIPTNNECKEKEYVYKELHDSDLYVLEFCLEKNLNEYKSEINCVTPTGLNSCPDVRDSQRVFDIKKITNAMLKMYHENGYYFEDNDHENNYEGCSQINDLYRDTNCSTVTSEENSNPGSTYGSPIPCPAQSNWCIKLLANINDVDYSSGTACDSGTVYLRNIPLNNYLPTGEWATGWYPYKLFALNNFNQFGGGDDDYLRIKYRLESSATGEFQSDHFLNGFPANCRHDSDYPQQQEIFCE